MNSSLTFCIVFKRFLIKIGKKKKEEEGGGYWALNTQPFSSDFML
jgi:hypothetical protein